MKYILALMLLVCVGCGSKFADKAVSKDLEDEAPPVVNCGDQDDLDVAVVDGENRVVNIAVGGKLLKTIEVPGFSLGEARKTKEGFDISIEYGSRYYFSKRLMFECKKDGFYLTKIKVESFDKTNPSKWTNKTVMVKPPVSLRDFQLMKYAVGE